MSGTPLLFPDGTITLVSTSTPENRTITCNRTLTNITCDTLTGKSLTRLGKPAFNGFITTVDPKYHLFQFSTNDSVVYHYEKGKCISCENEDIVLKDDRADNMVCLKCMMNTAKTFGTKECDICFNKNFGISWTTVDSMNRHLCMNCIMLSVMRTETRAQLDQLQNIV